MSWLRLSALAIGAVGALCHPAQAAPPNIDDLLRSHTESVDRTRMAATYNLIADASATWDAVSGLPYVGTLTSTVDIALLPAFYANSETVTDSARRALDEAMGSALRSSIETALGKQLDELDGSETVAALIARQELENKLRQAANKPTGKNRLLPKETQALLDLLDRARQSDINVAMLKSYTAERDLKRLATRQLRLSGEIDAMARRLDDVEHAITSYEAATANANKAAREWMTSAWSDLDFDMRLQAARDCQANAASPSCAVPESERDEALARGELRDAAKSVGEFTQLYVNGAAATARNLGVDIPEWASKSIDTVSVASGLVAGVASGKPEAIVAGIVGLTGLFRNARPSTESRILAGLSKIDTRLQRIEHKLDMVDSKLLLVLDTQRNILQSLQRIEAQLETVKDLSNAILEGLDKVLNDDLRSCQLAVFPRDAVGQWHEFFQSDRLAATRHHPDYNAPNNLDDLKVCRSFVRKRLSNPPEDLVMLERFEGASAHTADEIVAEEARLRSFMTALRNFLGSAWYERLDLALLPSASSRTSLILRFMTLDRVPSPSTPPLADSVPRLLSLKRVLTFSALAATSYRLAVREQSHQDTHLKEGLANAQHLLARYIEQRYLLNSDSDLLSAFVATKYVLALPSKPAQAAPIAWIDGTAMSHGPRGPEAAISPVEREKHFVGDVVDALLWRAFLDPTLFRQKRNALVYAWSAGATDTMAILLRSVSLPWAPGKTLDNNIEVAMVERVSGSGQLAPALCLRDLVESPSALVKNRCLLLEDFERRAGSGEPQGVGLARRWVDALGEERAHGAIVAQRP